ncbi:CbiN domain protein [Bacillus cereus]|nr:CbiN domain protein [Bacillus cereus]
MLPVVIICSFILIIFSEKSYACDCINVSAEEALQKNDVHKLPFINSNLPFFSHFNFTINFTSFKPFPV